MSADSPAPSTQRHYTEVVIGPEEHHAVRRRYLIVIESNVDLEGYIEDHDGPWDEHGEDAFPDDAEMAEDVQLWCNQWGYPMPAAHGVWSLGNPDLLTDEQIIKTIREDVAGER